MATRSRNNNSNDRVVRMLPRDLFCERIAGFLGRREMASLVMQVDEWVNAFDLREDFCEEHGTRLDAPSGAAKKKEVARLDAPSDGGNESEEKECIDCEMAKINHFRCEQCEGFAVRPDNFNHCDTCDKEACNHCLGTTVCSMCVKEECNSCGQDIFTCYECNESYCDRCRDTYRCGICDDIFCGDCQGFECAECNGCYCHDCRMSYECETCNKICCFDCRASFLCAACDQCHCDECRESFECCDCHLYFCRQCQDSIYCTECDGISCGDCRKYYHRGHIFMNGQQR